MTATANRFADLEALAVRVREQIIRMAGGGGCFIGASLSCADLLVYLYSRVLRVTPQTLQDPNRDYFFLSKGHDVPALYATLAQRGFFEQERLSRHLQISDSFYWHPNTQVPGVEFHSGSLGHLLSVSIGICLDIRLRRGSNRVFVLLGDGELNEGSIWEGLLVANAHRLSNLCVIIDRNEYQANARTEALIPLEPLEEKLCSFGLTTETADGHRFDQLEEAFGRLLEHRAGPKALIARTARGKGLPSLEQRADRWFASFTPQEVDGLLAELRGEAQARLTSEKLRVR